MIVFLERRHATSFSELTTGLRTIICLDSYDYTSTDTLEITQSITIACEGQVARAGRIVINAPSVVVVLRGLTITGHYGDAGDTGIDFKDGNALHLESSQVIGWAGIGIQFRPTGTSRLYVTDSVISENGTFTGGGGVFVQPSGSGSARVSLSRVTMNQNTHGIFADGTGTTGSIVVQVDGSVVAGSLGNGIWAKRAGIVVDRTSSKNNAGYGVLADGPGSLFHLSNSMVVGNGAGLGTANGTGQIFSYGNNQTKGNGFDGAPTGALTRN